MLKDEIKKKKLILKIIKVERGLNLIETKI